MSMLSPSRLEAADTLVCQAPFEFLVAYQQLAAENAADLERDFPQYRDAGFFPYDASDCGPSFNQLIEEMTSREFANAIGQRVGIPELGSYPSLVTISRYLNKTHGKIHTDGASKIVTALLYLNHEWPQTSAGCLRFLEKIDDMDSVVVPEVRPMYGTLAAFRRADNSFHGHYPLQGERRVIQVAWLTSEEEKLRKSRRGHTSQFIKKLTGFFDRRSHQTRETAGMR